MSTSNLEPVIMFSVNGRNTILWGKLISNHRGVGRGKKQQTIYSITTRKSHQKALKKALEDLNAQIMDDSILFYNQDTYLVNP